MAALRYLISLMSVTPLTVHLVAKLSIKQGLDAGTDAGRNVVMEAATTRRRIRTMTHDIYKIISRVGK